MKTMKRLIKWVYGLFKKSKAVAIRCNECKQANAIALVTFCSKENPVVDYPVCGACLAEIGKKYKSTWASSQICIRKTA